MDNKQISDKLLEMAKFYQMTDEELVVIGKVIEMVESADDDLISRQAALDAFWKLDIEIRPSAIDAITIMLNDIPSVTPQQKVGRWIAQDIHNCHTDFKCSECGYIHSFMHLYGEPTADYTYCPNCGAKMEGSEE